MNYKLILQKLDTIEQLIKDQTLLKKQVLDFEEAVAFTGLSRGYMYQLTSKRMIPYFRPNGKRLYFNRAELEQWMQRNRQQTVEEIEEEAMAVLRR